jgi:hypothetical protein
MRKKPPQIKVLELCSFSLVVTKSMAFARDKFLNIVRTAKVPRNGRTCASKSEVLPTRNESTVSETPFTSANPSSGSTRNGRACASKSEVFPRYTTIVCGPGVSASDRGSSLMTDLHS